MVIVSITRSWPYTTRNINSNSGEPGPTVSEESNEKYLQEFLARQEQHRQERKAAQIPELSTFNMHYGRTASEIESHPGKSDCLREEEI